MEQEKEAHEWKEPLRETFADRFVELYGERVRAECEMLMQQNPDLTYGELVWLHHEKMLANADELTDGDDQIMEAAA